MTATGQIGQYRILRKIGVGGMGMVFSGEHLLIQRRAAIKTLLPELSRRPEIVDRFFNEARATSAIGDPGIVQVFDFGYHVDGTAYIVMELLEGEGLADRLDRLGTLPIQAALRIARQVASSLAAAHAKGIVHRDLKPENIFLIRDCEAQGGERTKILDFGICAVVEAPETAAPAETMIGTPIYMAPEQCRGGQGDPRSDIYGLGCVLFQMLTGKAPFERDSVSEVIQAHLVEPPPIPSALREDLPALVDELVGRCLAKAPEDRFPSMTELGAALEHALAWLSAPEPPVFELPLEVPLGAGYRSVFDASAPTYDAPIEPAEPPGRPSHAMDAVDAVDKDAVDKDAVDKIGAPRRSGPLGRAALGLALLGGAVLASLAARFTEGDDALARAAMAPVPQMIAPAVAAGPTPAPRPARAAAVEPPPSPPALAVTSPAAAPPASRAPASPRVAGHAPAPPGPPSMTAPAPAPPARPRRATPPPATAAPASAPAASAPASPPVVPSEDLYDSR